MGWEDFVINTAISTVLLLLKSPSKAAKAKSALLKIYRSIKLAFPAETQAIDEGS